MTRVLVEVCGRKFLPLRIGLIRLLRKVNPVGRDAEDLGFRAHSAPDCMEKKAHDGRGHQDLGSKEPLVQSGRNFVT